MKNPFICDRIKEFRKAKGITQAELAQKTNISLSNISKYESGNRTPKTEYLLKIAEALDVNIDSLLNIRAKGERAFDDLLEELGCSFVYYQRNIYDDKGNQVGLKDEIEESIIYKGKEYLLNTNLKDTPHIDKLRKDVVAYTEFKIQQLINECNSQKR